MIGQKLILAAIALIPFVAPAPARAHGHGSHGFGGMSLHTGHKGYEAPSGNHSGPGPGVINYAPAIYLGFNPYGYAYGPYAPPLTVVGPGGFGQANPWAVGPLTAPGLDPLAIAMVPVVNQANANAWAPEPVARAPVRPRRVDPARVAELVTIGDRLLRAGNLSRAVERFEQANKADPEKAAPLVHLAQVAIIRGKYSDAANRLREAQTAQPGWLVTAPDIQGLFPEPGDFARHIAKLEAHLQANPQDRDAWLVLGAEWFLSGRTQKAADVFLRLSDREQDPTLRAFREAATAR